jgi:hypothetical protein
MKCFVIATCTRESGRYAGCINGNLIEIKDADADNGYWQNIIIHCAAFPLDENKTNFATSDVVERFTVYTTGVARGCRCTPPAAKCNPPSDNVHPSDNVEVTVD